MNYEVNTMCLKFHTLRPLIIAIYSIFLGVDKLEYVNLRNFATNLQKDKKNITLL